MGVRAFGKRFLRLFVCAALCAVAIVLLASQHALAAEEAVPAPAADNAALTTAAEQIEQAEQVEQAGQAGQIEQEGDQAADDTAQPEGSDSELGNGQQESLSSDEAPETAALSASASAMDELAAQYAAYRPAEGSCCVISTSLDANKVLDVASGSTANGANVQIYQFNQTDAQKWEAVYVGDYLVLRNVKSGKALAVSGSGAAGDNVVQLLFDAQSAGQLWVLTSDGRLLSALGSGLALDVASACTDNGTNVQLYTANGTAAQRFSCTTMEQVRSDLDVLANENRNALTDGAEYVISSNLSYFKVADVENGSVSSGTNVRLYQSNMTEAQIWRVSHDAAGYVTFTNVKSGKVLAVAGAGLAGNNVCQMPSTGSYAEKWIYTADGLLLSALYRQLALDVDCGSTANGTNIKIYSINGNTAQKFTLFDTHPAVEACEDILPSGYAVIHATSNGGYVLDIASGSVSSGANVQLYTSNDTFAQLFTFAFENGYYRIVSVNSGLCLEAVSGGVCPGTNVAQATPVAGAARQLFSARKNADGSFLFICKANGLALDVANGSISAGSNIQMWIANGTTAQRYQVSARSGVLVDGAYTVNTALSSSKVLDVAGGSRSDGANVQIYVSNSSFAQKWQFTAASGKGASVYAIQSIGSAKYLTAKSDGNVVQADGTGDDASQLWVVSVEKGRVILKNLSTGTVLNVEKGAATDGANVNVVADNGATAQRFGIARTDLVTPGFYFVRNAQDTSYVLDVANGSKSDGANVRLYVSNSSAAQKWDISKNSDGSYTIKNCGSRKALDVANGSAQAGANIQQYTSNGTSAQRWIARWDAERGGIVFVSKMGDTLVMAADGSAASGTNVALAKATAEPNQSWILEKTSYQYMSDQELAMYNKAQGYWSATDYLILIDTVNCYFAVFEGSQGNWEYVQFWRCSTGAPATPTILGEYTMGYKGYSFGSGFTCYYYSQIQGDYLIHSGEYYQGTFVEMDNRMGVHISHGCVRLLLDNAYWVYSVVPSGTKIVTY